MIIEVISITSRSISIEALNDECFNLGNGAALYINNEKAADIDVNVYTLNSLMPETDYELYLEDKTTKKASNRIMVRTKAESAVVNVRDFGAKGDGIQADCAAIQAAVAACPQGGRILFPEGIYLTSPIFLKSGITLELEKNAVLLGMKKRENYPILPGILRSSREEDGLYLGSWEGEPANCFASLITGIGVENVSIIGQGIIDGNADFDNWWCDVKKRNTAWRPRTIFLNGCSNVVLEGVTIRNSPSWTVHPLMSNTLKFINLNIENPKNAPNTDGINPESCRNVLISGVKFSVGDDCIAIKSGKMSTSEKFCRASQEIYIRNCRMEYGHGAVVIGSEMSGGVKKVYIERCIFNSTDRGIRIKTRRGRGSKGIIDEIYAANIKMDRVQTPFVINCFYFCDADGKTEYVWSKKALPADNRTPHIGSVHLKDICCENVQVAAAFMYGLPESKIEKVEMENIQIHFDPEAEAGYADMMSFLKLMCRHGLYFNNVKKLRLKNIGIQNVNGEEIVKFNIDEEILE